MKLKQEDKRLYIPKYKAGDVLHALEAEDRYIVILDIKNAVNGQASYVYLIATHSHDIDTLIRAHTSGEHEPPFTWLVRPFDTHNYNFIDNRAYLFKPGIHKENKRLENIIKKQS